MKKQIHHLHVFRVLMFTLLVGAVGLVQAGPHGLPRLSYSSNPSVLAYATSISRSDLLQTANQSRAANGLGPLALSSALNSSAQMKAQHMVNNNYWAHVAPDGTQPWYFFTQAGYNYTTAGENLAYGFATSNDTNQGWMNSPTHRANILGDYKDVGFGFVNGSTFQGGQNTVVVAHYGTLTSPTPQPKPTPTPTQPKPEPTPEPAVESSAQETPATTPAEARSSESEPQTPPEDSPETNEQQERESNEELATPTDQETPPPIATGTASSVLVWQSILRGSLPTMAIISLGLVTVAAVGYGVTHRSLVRHAVVSGEQFALHHPAFDAMAVTTAALLILLTTVAQLQ